MNPMVENRAQNSTFFMSYNMRFPEHLHAHMELVIVRKGKLMIDIDHQRHTLSPGDAALVFPDTLHGYPEQENENETLMLIFLPDTMPDMRVDFHSLRPTKPVIKLPLDAALCADRMRELLPLSYENEPLFWAYLRLFLLTALPQAELCAYQKQAVHDALYQALDYISREYASALTLKALAKSTGYSEYYLSHLFRQKLHMGFREYLGVIRVGKARDMLCGTDRSVTDICYDCGFESLRTFGRIFTANYGLSPRAYRKANKG